MMGIAPARLDACAKTTTDKLADSDRGAPSASACMSVMVMLLLSMSVLLSISTWLAASVVTDYFSSWYDVETSTTALLTVATQLGFMVSAFAQAIAMLPDRVNCRWLMAIGGLSAASVNALMLWAPTFEAALALRFLTGVSMALVYPPATKVVSTWFVENRGLAMSILVGSISPGSGLPSLIKALPFGDLWSTREGFILLTQVQPAPSMIPPATCCCS